MNNIFLPNRKNVKIAAAILATIAATRWTGNTFFFSLALIRSHVTPCRHMVFVCLSFCLPGWPLAGSLFRVAFCD